MGEAIKNPAKKAAAATGNAMNVIVVNFLGRFLSRLPDGMAGLLGAILIAASWIATGVIRYTKPEWDIDLQTTVQWAIDTAHEIGWIGLGVEAADRAIDADPPDLSPDGNPRPKQLNP